MMLPKPVAMPRGLFYAPAVIFLMPQSAFPYFTGSPVPHHAASITCTTCQSPWRHSTTGRNKSLLPCPAASPVPEDAQHDALGKLYLPPGFQRGREG